MRNLSRIPGPSAFLSAAAGLAMSGFVGHAAAQGLDRPMGEAWPARQAWSPALEAEYSQFVSTIGRAVAAGRCGRLERCLNEPSVNPLFEPGQRRLHFRADCADTPYVLRAYFSYRRGLPFAYSASMRGHGRDPRYLGGARPSGLRPWTAFATPRALLEHIGDQVHTGYLRTAPEVETADFYPAAIDRQGVRPGTVYYDPNGHALVVYEVRPDGDVLLFDGHPDNSLSHPHFSDRYALGSPRQGGGFKNFRPIALQNGAIVQSPNAALSDFAGASVATAAPFVVERHPVGYHLWVRSRLALPGALPTRVLLAAAAAAPRRHYTRWPARVASRGEVFAEADVGVLAQREELAMRGAKTRRRAPRRHAAVR